MSAEEELLYNKFLTTALKRSTYLELGKPRYANREFNRLHAIKDQLRGLPDRGKRVIERVLASDNVHVQINAAAALLAVDEERALEILDKIASRGLGLPSFTAQMTAEEWKKGNLRKYWG